MHKKAGFTLIELMITIVIIAILATLTTVAYNKARANSKLARVSNELVSLSTSVSQYASDNNYQYPPDSGTGVPTGLTPYLAGGTWPTSAWPKGIFNWNNWTTVLGNPSPQILQISYRLCGPSDNVSYCSDPILFPHFTANSAIFYCIQGPCVPQQNYPNDPGYCVNCKTKPVNPPL